ncbi:MAG: CpaF family protein, partial [Kiritimatiellae bacterium]|nr:CpaF family protein [Kiritimatiellia bacterium]
DPSLVKMMRSVKAQIHAELIDRLDIKRLSASRVNIEELRQRARETLVSIINDVKNKLPPEIDPKLLEQDILNEALGLGPLEDLLADDSVTEIMVNGPDKIFVERKGKLVLSDKTFMDAQSVMSVIERIVAPLGRRVDESQPYVDARLADGSRVNCVIHPLSLIGPCITIRKFAKRQLFDKDLINFGTLTENMAEFLKVCVKVRKNIVVSGGTGSGKTTLLNVLSNYLPEGERILTIEDAAELRLNQPHLVRLEARPPNIEGRGAITIRDLVRNALRMRPDRIIVGECRGGEALDMLQAMNTGHDGSLTTVHANAPRDVIARLETMVLMSGMELPSRAIREQIASAIDIIVHESRLSDGSRKVTCISEVVGLEGNQITMQDIFEFKQTGISAQGKVVGHYRATGAVPTFFTDLAARGITLDPAIFQP